MTSTKDSPKTSAVVRLRTHPYPARSRLHVRGYHGGNEKVLRHLGNNPTVARIDQDVRTVAVRVVDKSLRRHPNDLSREKNSIFSKVAVNAAAGVEIYDDEEAWAVYHFCLSTTSEKRKERSLTLRPLSSCAILDEMPCIATYESWSRMNAGVQVLWTTLSTSATNWPSN